MNQDMTWKKITYARQKKSCNLWCKVKILLICLKYKYFSVWNTSYYIILNDWKKKTIFLVFYQKCRRYETRNWKGRRTTFFFKNVKLLNMKYWSNVSPIWEDLMRNFWNYLSQPEDKDSAGAPDQVRRSLWGVELTCHCAYSWCRAGSSCQFDMQRQTEGCGKNPHLLAEARLSHAFATAEK